jgi:hypothetical protein
MHGLGYCLVCQARHLGAHFELFGCWATYQAQHRGEQQERLARRFGLFHRHWRR